jgi:hypothetical protein
MPTAGNLDVFVSVGGTANEEQESFVRSVEDRLRGEGITPHTVGRNTFSSDSPLKTVMGLMNECCGTVIIAFERQYFSSGIEKRGGSKAATLSDVKLPTCWNQIEAAIAYTRGHPLMVIVEDGLRTEGLLERGYDWYVQYVRLDAGALNSNEFNGVLASWKDKVRGFKSSVGKTTAQTIAPAELTVGQLVTGMKTAQLWSLIAALAALVAGAFALGTKFAVK